VVPNYYALLVERNQEMAYMALIRKLEKRFGFRELPETAQVQFNNARQTPDELLEDSKALKILVSPPFEDYAQGWSQI
jgi:hypothetical protein